MKFAVREAVDVYFKAKTVTKLGARTIRAGEPIMILDTVTVGTMEGAAEVTYVTGGRGNSRLLSYEGDKTLTFTFTDALLSVEGLAILAGADLIPARNPHLPAASPNARAVIAHYTEKYPVTTQNIVDSDSTNAYPIDPNIEGVPRGGLLNVWLTRKPYVGQNASIYVLLLDQAGELSGSPLQINLQNDPSDGTMSYLDKFTNGDKFVAFDEAGAPMSLVDFPQPKDAYENGIFDDIAKHYVDFDELSIANGNWSASWGLDEDIMADYGRTISSDTRYSWDVTPIVTTNYKVTPTNGVPTVGGSGYSVGDILGATINPNTLVADDTPPVPNTGWTIDKFQMRVDAVNGAGAITKCTITPNIAKHAIVTGQTGVVTYPAFAEPVPFTNISGMGLGSGAATTISFSVNTPAPYSSGGNYTYLLAPSGGIAQPKAHKVGSEIWYKLNVPSILYQDIVLLDYYVENQHSATQISILPDKFGPYVYIEGSSLVRRASDGVDLPLEFVIPKAKIQTAITFTLQATGDASTFDFTADAYPDFSKFDLTRKVLADIQILDADDNYDSGAVDAPADPTKYRRYRYNVDGAENDAAYLWKDVEMQPHDNLDYSDIQGAQTGTNVTPSESPAVPAYWPDREPPNP